MTRDMIRLGLVGAGRWGRRLIETIRSIEGASLALVASRNPATASYAPEARVVSDWRELLAADLDAAVIATPPGLHGPMVRAFVQARIPSMVEKPLCLDLAEANELNDFVRASGVPVMVDHTQLFHPAWNVLKRRAEELGPVRFVRSEGMAYGPLRSDVPVLWDWTPHDVSLCIDLFGKLPERVSALGSEDSVDVWLEFEGGAPAHIANSNVSVEKRRSFAVYADRHVLVLDDRSVPNLVEYQSRLDPLDGGAVLGPPTALPVPEGMPLTRALEHFVEGVTGGDRSGFGLELAADVVRTLDAAQVSMDHAGTQALLEPA